MLLGEHPKIWCIWFRHLRGLEMHLRSFRTAPKEAMLASALHEHKQFWRLGGHWSHPDAKNSLRVRWIISSKVCSIWGELSGGSSDGKPPSTGGLGKISQIYLRLLCWCIKAFVLRFSPFGLVISSRWGSARGGHPRLLANTDAATKCCMGS